jgi:hypothetical protein
MGMLLDVIILKDGREYGRKQISYSYTSRLSLQPLKLCLLVFVHSLVFEC